MTAYLDLASLAAAGLPVLEDLNAAGPVGISKLRGGSGIRVLHTPGCCWGRWYPRLDPAVEVGERRFEVCSTDGADPGAVQHVTATATSLTHASPHLLEHTAQLAAVSAQPPGSDAAATALDAARRHLERAGRAAERSQMGVAPLPTTLAHSEAAHERVRAQFAAAWLANHDVTGPASYVIFRTYGTSFTPAPQLLGTRLAVTPVLRGPMPWSPRWTIGTLPDLTGQPWWQTSRVSRYVTYLGPADPRVPTALWDALPDSVDPAAQPKRARELFQALRTALT